MSNNDYRLVRGMKDLCNLEARKFDFIIKIAIEMAEEMNFKHLTTPIVEYTSLFDRNLGEESDVVSKELYSFEDKGGDLLSLRPEMTAGVCRHVIENGLFQGPFPHKFFSYGSVFRYDRPQKGRYRQFNQLNYEVFGLQDYALEIFQYLVFIKKFLKKIGISDIVIKINNLGGKDERKNYISALKEYLLQYKNDLSEDSKRRLKKNVLRILDSKDEQDKKILKNAPSIENFLTEKNRDFLYSFVKKDKTMKIDNNLVRGLDYYSGFVFEIITDKIGATQDSICGGGEYNGLVKEMSGQQVNAFGFAMGIERLMGLIEDGYVPKEKKLYCHFTEKSAFIKDARNEMKYGIDLAKGLKWANQIGADYVIFEKDGKIIQKDLASGEQKELNKS